MEVGATRTIAAAMLAPPRRTIPLVAAAVLAWPAAAGAESLVEDADSPEWVRLFNLGAVPFDVNARLFDEPGDQLDGVSTLASLGAFGGLTLVFAGIVWFGYQRMEITK